MTLKELLEQHKVADVEKILSDMAENKIYTAGEENLDIRYGKMKTDKESLEKQLVAAQKTIDDLKKGTEGNADLQKKIKEYEAEVTRLKAELTKTKVEAELRTELLEAGVTDVDYISYQMGKAGPVELGEDGKIKDFKDKIESLKKSHPNQFTDTSKKTYLQNKLPPKKPGGEDEAPETLADALKDHYEHKGE